MRSTFHLACCASAGILAMLAGWQALSPSQPAASAPAACLPDQTIRVPDDCATIQAAIEAVYDGGQVSIRETSDVTTTFAENLVVTKSLVLWGGWDAAFTESNGDTVLDARRLGRGVTISGSQELMVKLRGMTIVSGTADGLGGLTVGAEFTITESYTGALSAQAAAPFVGLAGDDCGGGIYARNAHLRLYNVRVRDSIASASGRGFGGGVCAVDVPTKDPSDMPPPFTPSLRIEEGSEISDNTASTAAEGAGGGVFMANGTGRMFISGATLSRNTGSMAASAYGGGAFGVDIGSFFIGAQNQFDGNVASRSATPDDFGRGGGAAAVNAYTALVSNAVFDGNTAAIAARGYGGGLFLRGVNGGIELRESRYLGNQASASTDAGGYGGGMLLEEISSGPDNYVRLNHFEDNVAAAGGQGGGGGLFATTAPLAKFLFNTLIGNQAVVSATRGGSFGGGLALIDSIHPLIENNRVLGNAAAGNGTNTGELHRGGGIYLLRVDEPLIGENDIITNTAATGLPGEGGGVYLQDCASNEDRLVRILDNRIDGNAASQGGGALVRDSSEALVRHNRFFSNTAAGLPSAGAGAGGGLLVRQTTGATMTVTVDRNHFLRNTAGPAVTTGGGAAAVGVGDLTLVNNVFAGNGGSGAAGLYIEARPGAQLSDSAANNTFSANAGPAIGVQGWADPPFTFHNTLIANQDVGVQVSAGTSVTLDYTLWHSTTIRGAGAFSDLHPATGDPVFSDVAKDDYHVRKPSAARDAGDPAGIPPAPSTDLAGAARPFGARVDIGAYEWRDAVHWPNDYPTLKEAIDAALPGDGDTIWAVGQGYGATEEQLRLTRSITLSGGWDPDFEQRDPQGPTFWINQPNVKGRFLTISGGPGVVVRIEGFSFDSGDATGQGGLPDTETTTRLQRSASTLAPAAAQPDAPAAPSLAALRERTARLAAAGRLPAETSGAMLALLDNLDEAASLAASQALDAPARPTAETDCGGAIFSTDAGLYLSESYFQKNIASQSGDGHGGALCVLNAPAGQLVVHDVEMRRNIGSLAGASMGGAIYIADSPQAQLDGLRLSLNIASAGGTAGSGGGLMIMNSSGVTVANSQFDGNIAAGRWGANAGTGGGAEIWDSDDAQVADSIFRGNLGGPMCITCRGGGLSLGSSQGARLAGNTFWNNLAGFAEGPVGFNGGGLSMDAVRGSQVLSNTFANNSAGAAGGNFNAGGAMYGIALSDILVAGNVITANWASQVGPGHGGGAYFEPSNRAPSEGLTFQDNQFTRNAASLSGSAYRASAGGGGLELLTTTDASVSRNRFEDNSAAADMPGMGGGLLLRSPVGELGGSATPIHTTVDGNLFAGNSAAYGESAGGESAGGGIAASGVREYAIINNILDGNRAEYGGGMSLDIQDRMGEAFSATIMNNTLFANAASGIFLYGANEAAFIITNTAVVSHETGVSVPGDQTHVAMAYTLWNDVQQATDNPAMVQDAHPVTGPVEFVDAAAGDFRLRKTSAARDAGDPAGVPPAPGHDADGNPRPFGPRVDIGAYEWRGFQVRLPIVAVPLPPHAGWAIGWGENDGAVILHTADNGRIWTAQVDDAQWPGMPGNDISAVDDQTAWAALGANSPGAAGAILRTTDGGTTWISQTLPAGLADAVKSIKGLSVNEAWAATLGGTVLHTTDGGASWGIVPHTGVSITQVNRMDADSAGNVWIADASPDGAVARTRDGGLTWRRELLPPAGGNAHDAPLTVHTVNPTVTWASGVLGAIFYRTVNGGDLWDTAIAVGGLDHLDDVCAAGADDAWGAQNGDGANGYIWRVHMGAGGAQAFNVTPPEVAGYTPAGVTCIGATTAWVVANRGLYTDPSLPASVIVHTQDGAVWEQQAAPVSASLWKVSFAGARR